MDAYMKKHKKEIDSYLKSLDTSELYNIIYSFSEKHQDVAEYLKVNTLLYRKDIKSLVNRIHEISSAVWNGLRSRSRGLFIPDYSQLTLTLQALLDAGHADQLLDLGNEIIEECRNQLEENEDSPRVHENQVIKAFTPVLEVLKNAALESSLSDEERLLWIFDAALLYGTEEICQPFIEYLTDDANKDYWDLVVDALLERMEEGDFEDTYSPGAQQWCKYAFECAGRSDEFPEDNA